VVSGRIEPAPEGCGVVARIRPPASVALLLLLPAVPLLRALIGSAEMRFLLPFALACSVGLGVVSLAQGNWPTVDVAYRRSATRIVSGGGDERSSIGRRSSGATNKASARQFQMTIGMRAGAGWGSPSSVCIGGKSSARRSQRSLEELAMRRALGTWRHRQRRGFVRT
jgi:hypothetical protein